MQVIKIKLCYDIALESISKLIFNYIFFLNIKIKLKGSHKHPEIHQCQNC